ncbi:MAG: AGE family epimerase/isomerase [Pseudomonadota bacterium]
MSVERLTKCAEQARGWMLNAMFPLWAKEGVAPSGLFADRLTLNHRFMPTETTRARVQARQTYVFASALDLGWRPEVAMALVQKGVAILERLSCSRGAIGHLVSIQDGRLIEDGGDLYDTAFALFALAHASSVVPGATTIAADILTALDNHFCDTENGGYAETIPRPAYRDQNPHMHMLEACHSLFHATGETKHLERGEEIVRLFETRMTDHPSGTLCERFALDWSPLEAASDDVIEPGHQFEWVWLLGRHATLSGGKVSPTLRPLYDTASATLDGAGRVLHRVRRDGTPVDASRRTWQQTDALKAHLTLFELTGEVFYVERAITSYNILMGEFLTPQGGWIDQFDADGAPMVDSMTAATGYHVVLAFRELMRVLGLS